MATETGPHAVHLAPVTAPCTYEDPTGHARAVRWPDRAEIHHSPELPTPAACWAWTWLQRNTPAHWGVVDVVIDELVTIVTIGPPQ